MNYQITIETAQPLTLAAVHATVPQSDIPTAWKPALDRVWTFLRTNQIPNTGQNVFLYRHPENPGPPMILNIDFGVHVSNPFENAGEVKCVTTPSGEVAQTIHTGPYSGLPDAHSALHRWCKANSRRIASASWEIYGHWNNDPAKLETTIRYLLA